MTDQEKEFWGKIREQVRRGAKIEQTNVVVSPTWVDCVNMFNIPGKMLSIPAEHADKFQAVLDVLGLKYSVSESKYPGMKSFCKQPEAA